MVCATSKGSDQPAHMGSLIRVFASCLNSMTVKLLTEQHLEFLSLKAAQACTSLHLSKCHIIGNHMPRLCYNVDTLTLVLLKPDISSSESSADPDQMASDKAI